MLSRIVVPTAAALAAALATPVLAGPDFVTADRAAPLAASDARAEQQPMDDIVYALGDATLTSTGGEQVAAVVRWLGVHPDGRVVVEGHADTTGTASFN